MKIHTEYRKNAPLFGWRIFQRKEKLTAEGKSFPHGCLLLTRTTTTKSKVLCATITLIGRIQGYETRNPSSSFGRLCDLYIIVLCHWQCPNNWTRFSDIKLLLNNQTICTPHIGQRQHLTNWITYIPHHQQAVGKDDISVISLTTCCKLYLW